MSLGCVLAPMVAAGVCGSALGHSAPAKGCVRACVCVCGVCLCLYL